MNDQYKVLEKIYYQFSQGGAYVGPDKLYRILKSKGITLGIHRVRKWLQDQDSYSLQKPARKSFRKARVVVSGIDDQFDADLANMSNLKDSNDQFSQLLFVIDIFSKYLWIQPLKNKTAKEVVRGFQVIFQNGRKCNKLRTDNGTEFTSNISKSYLQNEGIYHFTTQNSNTKANICERVIKTIKTKMYRYFTENRTYRYIDVLQDLTSSYNATPHRTLNNIAPKDVNTNNEADIWAHMYLKQKTSNKGLKPYHFKMNDLVRIASKNSTFERSYDEHFTREIFKVRKRFRMQGIPMYRLKSFLDADGEAGFIRGNFYENKMQKVHKNEDSLWYIEKKIANVR
ncbi:Hypothetical predicted protein [Mytilus galloprovincialis]|uniref:Integrase catalytic domain-containing protein n=1 Tax=Mytilus galloprovincialis TaxID=29158 RepID=A0A8B6EIH1_MYTGA|nr:Hypothetical predicted protein [Mytilus galloprovincialis]